MDSEKWTNEQIELARARKWRAEREKQIEHKECAQQSNDESDRAIEMLGMCGTAFICALILCALLLAWYADKLGLVK